MLLGETIHLNWSDAKVSTARALLEAGAPRMQFQYDRGRSDTPPDVLVLGDYTFNNGTDVIGGINLHYLTPDQIKQLRKLLPRIMGGRDLQDRYWNGRRLLPDVFNSYYRTYNTNYIRAVQPDELETWDWYDNILPWDRSKRKTMPPVTQPYPPTDRTTLKAQVPPRPRAPTPPQVAPTPAGAAVPAPTRRAAPGAVPAHTPDQAEIALKNQQIANKTELQRLTKQYQIRAAELQAIEAEKAKREADLRAKANFKREREQNIKALATPSPNADPKDPLDASTESITYYSPVQRKWIVEHIQM